MLISSWAGQAVVAAHTGREDEARVAARLAIDAARATGAAFHINSATAALGFLEVSLGHYEAAVAVLQPLITTFDSAHDTEIIMGAYLPDAIEALVALGRIDEAEPLVAALEHNGARHDRPWMLAAGARGRGHVHVALGDLDAAENAAHEALEHHQRLPMPFEKARTQLLLGQLQRRRRRRQAAEATLREALETFERLGAPLWASRVNAELPRLVNSAGDARGLTVTERALLSGLRPGYRTSRLPPICSLRRRLSR